MSLLAGSEDSQQTFETQVGQAGAFLLLPCVLDNTGDVGVTPHQHAAITKRYWDEMYSRLKRNPGQDLAKCRYTSQQQSLTMSRHRESGMFCLRSVHLGRLCVRFPPAAGSSAQPHLLRIAQNLHLSEAPTRPPLCSAYCL